jgi:DNA-binding transcriptional regulator YhcF (GntR family)
VEDGIHLANSIFVTHHSGLPVYRQIVSQLAFMIEMGQLKEGERLPSARLLADNLHINRNTVAHAYAELRDTGLLESKGRNGMVVVSGDRTQPSSVDGDRAAALLESAVAESMALGLAAAEVHSLAVSFAAREQAGNLELVFVECNSDRAKCTRLIG